MTFTIHVHIKSSHLNFEVIMNVNKHDVKDEVLTVGYW